MSDQILDTLFANRNEKVKLCCRLKTTNELVGFEEGDSSKCSYNYLLRKHVPSFQCGNKFQYHTCEKLSPIELDYYRQRIEFRELKKKNKN